VSARLELDLGNAANNQILWEGVQEAFKGHSEVYDNLNFGDDENLSELLHIDFSKIIPHDWNNL